MTITIKFYVDEAKARGWTIKWIDEYRNVVALYPPDEEPIIIRNNVTELATAIASVTSNLKSVATTLAQEVGFIVPKTLVIESEDTYQKALPLLSDVKRLVIKPMDAAFGDGISTNVTNEAELQDAIEKARKHNVKSEGVIAQEFCEGNDYRLFVLDGKVVAAIERVPLVVVGNGKQTIKELVESKVQQLHEREDNKIKPVSVELSEILGHLKTRQPSNVLGSNEKLIVQGVANLSKGGEAVDVTDMVNPQVAKQAVDLAHLMRMDMCAVDVLSQDIAEDQQTARTVFIEVNVAPGFRGHYYPSAGQRRKLAPMILDVILQKRKDKRLLQKMKNNV